MNLRLKRSLYVIVLFTGAALAQMIDYLVYIYIPENSGLPLLPFLELRHIRNFGGIFGIWQGSGIYFTIFGLMFLGFISGFILLKGDLSPYKYLCFGLIGAGALSNILARLIYGSVIDYINVIGIPYWHYIFNAADTFIHLGIWPLLLFDLLANRKKSAVSG